MDTKVIELKKGIFFTGVQDHDIRTFDVIMQTEYGTSYNSYIVKGDEKTALIDASKDAFTDEFLENVSKVIEPEKIDYLVVNHSEPDHSGSAEKLLEINPSLTIIGTMGGINFLKQIVNRPFDSIAAKDGIEIPLGGKTLRFYPLPNLHWPDTMFTHVPEDNVLFTCDAFGAHYAFDGVVRSALPASLEPDYNGAAKYYFDMILSPFKKPFVTNAIAVVDKLAPEIIATGHGPVLDTGVEETVDNYRTWCIDMPNPKKTAVIAYASAYGYTGELAKAIASGIKSAGDIDVKSYDLEVASPAEVLAEIARADGLLVGSPTIVAEALKPVWDILTSMHSPIHGGKPAAAFGSYGWSGEAVPNITERLKQLKMKTREGFRVRFRPTSDDLKSAHDFGAEFAGDM